MWHWKGGWGEINHIISKYCGVNKKEVGLRMSAASESTRSCRTCQQSSWPGAGGSLVEVASAGRTTYCDVAVARAHMSHADALAEKCVSMQREPWSAKACRLKVFMPLLLLRISRCLLPRKVDAGRRSVNARVDSG